MLCAKCGHVAVLPARRRTCWQQKFGPNSYACGGKLLKEATVSAVDAFHERIADQRNDVEGRWHKTRAAALAKLLHAQNKMGEAIRASILAATRVRAWQEKVRRYEKLAYRTDAEIEAERQKRLARKAARPKRRAMEIG